MSLRLLLKNVLHLFGKKNPIRVRRDLDHVEIAGISDRPHRSWIRAPWTIEACSVGCVQCGMLLLYHCRPPNTPVDDESGGFGKSCQLSSPYSKDL